MTLSPMAVVALLTLLSKSGTITTAELWRATIWMLFSLYPKVSEQVMSAFRCHELADGNAYLLADVAVACDAYYRSTVMPYAVMMFCIYALGVPVTRCALRVLRRFGCSLLASRLLSPVELLALELLLMHRAGALLLAP